MTSEPPTRMGADRHRTEGTGARKRLHASGGSLAVVCTGEDVLRVLRTMGLLRILRVCETVDEALAEAGAAEGPGDAVLR